MKKLLLSATMLSTLSLSAFAADLPSRKQEPIAPMAAAPIFTWTGFYAGANVGYGHLQTSTNHNAAGSGSGSSGSPPASGSGSGTSLGKTQHSANGVLGGLQFGYNYQFGSFVAGLEADIALASIRSSSSVQGAAQSSSSGAGPATTNLTSSDTMSSLGTVRGRLGFAVDKSLFYVTGGFAYARVHNSLSFNLTQSPIYDVGVTANSDTWKTGWTLGAGMEYALSAKWSVKAEALYFDLGKQKFDVSTTKAISGIGTAGLAGNWQNSGVIARVGINYRFGG